MKSLSRGGSVAPGEEPDDGGEGGAVEVSSSLGVLRRLRARSSSGAGGGSRGGGGEGDQAASNAPEYSSAGRPATSAAARLANNLSASIGRDSSRMLDIDLTDTPVNKEKSVNFALNKIFT